MFKKFFFNLNFFIVVGIPTTNINELYYYFKVKLL